jgi:probable rRNA maturation factor
MPTRASDLNRDYRGKDYATNVLTFAYGAASEAAPLTGRYRPLRAGGGPRGRRAGQFRSTAHYAHLTLHGMLHLQGYDHETKTDAAVTMEAIESFIMQRWDFDPLSIPEP